MKLMRKAIRHGGSFLRVTDKTRTGQGDPRRFRAALEALGADYPNVVVVDGDVGNSTRTEWFGKKYPERFFNVGIAESNLVGVAAGLAASGKTSVIASFAAFIMCNAYDQLRMSVAYPGSNVKVVGSHAGISIGEDGASQMGIEDVALACALPGFVVIVPGRRPVGPGRHCRDAQVQRAGLPSRRPSRSARDLLRRTWPRSRSARPTRSAMGRI